MYAPSILLLIAHPGDELGAAAGAIMRARTQGFQVHALVFTHGLPSRKSLPFWQRGKYDDKIEARLLASRQAAQLLGHRIEFFSSDRSVGSLPKCLNDLQSEISYAIKSFKPNVIWAPSYMGNSPDHDALSLVASTFAKTIETHEYAVPMPRGKGKTAQSTFPRRQGLEVPINLTIPEAAKRRGALEIWEPVAGKETSQESERELFRFFLADHDFTSLPAGTTLETIYPDTPLKQRQKLFEDASDKFHIFLQEQYQKNNTNAPPALTTTPPLGR